MGSDDGLVLLGREGAVLHGGAQLIAPPQPARFAGPALNVAADEGPVSRAVLFD